MLVRCKVLVDGSTGTHHSGDIMMGFGIISVLVASFSLLRQKDIKRMFAYSSIEHMGIATFAFGLGGPVATFGALLHMLVHSLTKSAIFFTVGHASQMHRTQEMDKIKGLIRGNPLVGWGDGAGRHGHRGDASLWSVHERVSDPHGHDQGRAAHGAVSAPGLAVTFAALFPEGPVHGLGRDPRSSETLKVAHVPVLLHMSLVLVLGLYMPKFLSDGSTRQWGC